VHHHWDVELTKLRRETGVYQDPRSEIHYDGREYLFGVDLQRRRREVYERDKHYCVRCGAFVTWETMHMHHRAKNHGAKRFDNLQNLETLCPSCHIGPGGYHP
jgi:5-methylcytosine-specific restriction endonuclease McrA